MEALEGGGEEILTKPIKKLERLTQVKLLFRIRFLTTGASE